MNVANVILVSCFVTSIILSRQSKVEAQDGNPAQEASGFISELTDALQARASISREWNSSRKGFDSVDSDTEPKEHGLSARALQEVDTQLKSIADEKSVLLELRDRMPTLLANADAATSELWPNSKKTIKEKFAGLSLEQATLRFNRYLGVRLGMLDTRSQSLVNKREFYVGKIKRLVSIRKNIDETTVTLLDSTALFDRISLPQKESAKALTERTVSNIYRQTLEELQTRQAGLKRSMNSIQRYVNSLESEDESAPQLLFACARKADALMLQKQVFQGLVDFAKKSKASSSGELANSSTEVESWVLDSLANEAMRAYPKAISGETSGYNAEKFEEHLKVVDSAYLRNIEDLKFLYEFAKNQVELLVEIQYLQGNVVGVGRFLDLGSREKVEAEVGFSPKDFALNQNVNQEDEQ